jgi:hypothetical protein
LEILAAIIGFWLVLVGAYIVLSVAASHRRVVREQGRQAGIRSAAFSARHGASTDQPVLGGLLSEVDTLRLQVETLRSEMSALSGDPQSERARLRRYSSGQYTELPRTLRRQVRAVRSFRHPVGA